MKKTNYCLETAIKETIFPLSWQPPKKSEIKIFISEIKIFISLACINNYSFWLF